MRLFDLLRDSEVKPAEEQVRIGDEAKHILTSSAYAEAMKMAETELLREWVNSEKLEERERAWNRVHALGELQRQLEILADRGAVANHKLLHRTQ